MSTMTEEQARTLAQFINDHDPRMRARIANDRNQENPGAIVQCYSRVENGGCGEDMESYNTVERYIADAQRATANDTTSTFAQKLNSWIGGGE